jgi:hypothetical protein
MRAVAEDFLAQGADHRLSEACAPDVQNIFDAADGQRCNQIPPHSQPSLSTLSLPANVFYNVPLQFERRCRQHRCRDRQDDQDKLLRRR